jgi:hypothetical protein
VVTQTTTEYAVPVRPARQRQSGTGRTEPLSARARRSLPAQSAATLTPVRFGCYEAEAAVEAPVLASAA